MRSSSHESMLHDKNKSSMDSLARKALLAAQVLHLIPTTKARERNFLQGRVAATSLLGTLELERLFPERQVTIFVGTWNMNGKTPPKLVVLIFNNLYNKNNFLSNIFIIQFNFD